MARCSSLISCVALLCRRLSDQTMSDTNLSDPRLSETKLSDARLSGPRRPKVPKAYAGRADPVPKGERSQSHPRMTPIRRVPREYTFPAGRADPGPQGGLGPIRVGPHCAGPPEGCAWPHAGRANPGSQGRGPTGVRVRPHCAGPPRGTRGPRRACKSGLPRARSQVPLRSA